MHYNIYELQSIAKNTIYSTNYMASTYKTLEQCQVKPAPKEASVTSLALTFLDIPFLRMLHTVKRLYFYEFPHSTKHFTENTLPSLKHSLALALGHFYPFAGTLICPASPHKPWILCSSADSVSLDAFESADDFTLLTRSSIKGIEALDHLIPQLPPARFKTETDEFMFRLLAVKVAVFPNSGVCIGVSYRHVVDGRTANNFMKTWASLHRGDDVSCDKSSLPVFERNLVNDPSGLEEVLLQQYYKLRSTWKLDSILKIDSLVSKNVRATFLLTRIDIETLREKVQVNGQHVSKLILTCGLVWSCLIKALDLSHSPKFSSVNDEDTLQFGLPADVRNRLATPVPATYFGNCLTVCFAMAKKRELVAAKTAGFVAAVRALDKAMTELKTEPLEGIDQRMLGSAKLFETFRLVAVTGSPNLGVYGTDFGFGRAKKVEAVHFCDATCFSVAESGESERGGIEVGLALNEAAMHAFSSALDETLGG